MFFINKKLKSNEYLNNTNNYNTNMETSNKNLFIINIQLYKQVTKIIAEKSKFVSIPFFANQQRFTSFSNEITFKCTNIDEKKSINDIIYFFLEGKKFKKKYFERYLGWFRYLGFDKLLQFFELSYYKTLNWKYYYFYVNILENKYERIFLTYQLLIANELKDNELVQILDNLQIKISSHIEDSTWVLYHLVYEAFETKIYTNLCQLLIDSGFGKTSPESNRRRNILNIENIAFKTMVNKLINANLEEIERIICDLYQENNLFGFILMYRYLDCNKINEAIKIFTEVKTCQKDVFRHLFGLSNDEQRDKILQHCRVKDKFDLNNKYYDISVYYTTIDKAQYIINIYLNINETDYTLDSVEDISDKKKYFYDTDRKKYVQN